MLGDTEEQDERPIELSPVGAHQIYLWLLPLLLLLSHRNIVAAVMLMGISALFYKGAVENIKTTTTRPQLFTKDAHAVFFWVMLFCGYATLSLFWTPVLHRGTWSPQLILFCVLCASALWFACVVPAVQATKLARLFCVMVIISAVLLGFEGITMGWLRDIVPPEARPDKDIVASARGTGLAIILCFPALYILMQEEKWPLGMSATARRVILALVIGMLLIAALRLTVAANVLALLVGVIAAAIALLQPRLVWHLCMAALALAFVVAPFAGMLLPGVEEVTQLESGPTSWVQRLAIWRNVSDLIFSSPLIFLFGGGIQFGWAVSEAGNMIEISNFDYALKIMPTHPHNYFLQIWLEFGLVGVLLHLGALWQLWAMMQKKTLTNRQMSMICGVIGAVLVFASVETSLWTLWRLAAPVLAVYVIILAVRSQKIK